MFGHKEPMCKMWSLLHVVLILVLMYITGHMLPPAAGFPYPMLMDPAEIEAQLTLAEEQMAEALSEGGPNDPVRIQLHALIKAAGGRFTGTAARFNYLIDEYMQTTPAPTTAPVTTTTPVPTTVSTTVYNVSTTGMVSDSGMKGNMSGSQKGKRRHKPEIHSVSTTVVPKPVTGDVTKPVLNAPRLVITKDRHPTQPAQGPSTEPQRQRQAQAASATTNKTQLGPTVSDLLVQPSVDANQAQGGQSLSGNTRIVAATKQELQGQLDPSGQIQQGHQTNNHSVTETISPDGISQLQKRNQRTRHVVNGQVKQPSAGTSTTQGGQPLLYSQWDQATEVIDRQQVQRPQNQRSQNTQYPQEPQIRTAPPTRSPHMQLILDTQTPLLNHQDATQFTQRIWNTQAPLSPLDLSQSRSTNHSNQSALLPPDKFGQLVATIIVEWGQAILEQFGKAPAGNTDPVHPKQNADQSHANPYGYNVSSLGNGKAQSIHVSNIEHPIPQLVHGQSRPKFHQRNPSLQKQQKQHASTHQHHSGTVQSENRLTTISGHTSSIYPGKAEVGSVPLKRNSLGTNVSPGIDNIKQSVSQLGQTHSRPNLYQLNSSHPKLQYAKSKQNQNEAAYSQIRQTQQQHTKQNQMHNSSQNRQMPRGSYNNNQLTVMRYYGRIPPQSQAVGINYNQGQLHQQKTNPSHQGYPSIDPYYNNKHNQGQRLSHAIRNSQMQIPINRNAAATNNQPSEFYNQPPRGYLQSQPSSKGPVPPTNNPSNKKHTLPTQHTQSYNNQQSSDYGISPSYNNTNESQSPRHLARTTPSATNGNHSQPSRHPYSNDQQKHGYQPTQPVRYNQNHVYRPSPTVTAHQTSPHVQSHLTYKYQSTPPVHNTQNRVYQSTPPVHNTQNRVNQSSPPVHNNQTV